MLDIVQEGRSYHHDQVEGELLGRTPWNILVRPSELSISEFLDDMREYSLSMMIRSI